MYPRTMHSIGSISTFLTSIDLPAISGTWALDGKSDKSVEMRWDFIDVEKCSNQNADIAINTRPLSGTGWFITTSKADMRSLVTIKYWLFPAS